MDGDEIDVVATGEDTATGRYSVAVPRAGWYPACRSTALGRPHAFTFMDTPLVAYRDDNGNPHVLLDRCPHRNAPLSAGRVHGDGTLECGYHGWRFDGGGALTAVPGLPGAIPNRCVPSHATFERDGFVWFWGQPDAPPVGGPIALPDMGDRNPGEVVFAWDLECTMHAALENSLDVPHTAFLHGGIFRGAGRTNEITATRRPIAGGAEVQFDGEPVGLGRIKPPGDATFQHWDRFLLPCVAQIEYRVPRRDGGDWLRIVNTIAHLPLAPMRTRAWFVVRFSTPLPARVAAPIVLARGKGILKQDARMLALQTEQALKFGGERYASTELDLLGPTIWRLLRAAERGEPTDAVPERSVTFRA